MKKTLVLILLLVSQGALSADFEMKGVKFGMTRGEIAKITNGYAFGSCSRALDDKPYNTPDRDRWSYGGLVNWAAFCIEEGPSVRLPSEVYDVFATSYKGLYEISTTVSQADGYSVEKLVEIFESRFGKFSPLDLTDRSVMATAGGALIRISNPEWGYYRVQITNLDFSLALIKAINNYQKLKTNKAKNDF